MELKEPLNLLYTANLDWKPRNVMMIIEESFLKFCFSFLVDKVAVPRWVPSECERTLLSGGVWWQPGDPVAQIWRRHTLYFHSGWRKNCCLKGERSLVPRCNSVSHIPFSQGKLFRRVQKSFRRLASTVSKHLPSKETEKTTAEIELNIYVWLIAYGYICFTYIRVLKIKDTLPVPYLRE